MQNDDGAGASPDHGSKTHDVAWPYKTRALHLSTIDAERGRRPSLWGSMTAVRRGQERGAVPAPIMSAFAPPPAPTPLNAHAVQVLRKVIEGIQGRMTCDWRSEDAIASVQLNGAAALVQR